MKRLITLALLICLPLALISCSNESPVNPPDKQSEGKVLLKVDKEAAPAGVSSITATLTRLGYDAIFKSMYLKTDTTADITFSGIIIGTWHLKVEAKSSAGAVLYIGETDVNVNEGITTQVNLTLNPTGAGVGNIAIFVTWGNGYKWADCLQNPLFTSKNSPTNPIGGVSTAKVYYDDGKYKMWYLNTYNSGTGDIGYAESPDGISWNSLTSEAVFTPGQTGSWDDHTVGPGAIIKENGVYKMYYIGWHSQYDNWHIGLATSSDGIHWQRYQNPVLSGSGIEAQLGVSDVVKCGSVYYMYYASRTSDMGNARLNVATSYDGINFTRYSGNPILVQSQAWEGTAIAFPTVLYDNGTFKLLYQNAAGTAFGLATSSDGLKWTKDPSNPFFKLSDVKNQWCEKIVYPFWKKFGNEYWLYYTGIVNGMNTVALAKR